MTKSRRITMNTLVHIDELTDTGLAAVHHTVDSEARERLRKVPSARTRGDVDEPRLSGGQTRRREARLPLWELISIFGPHIKSSLDLPFFEVYVYEDPELSVADVRRLKAEARTKLVHDQLRVLAKAVGLCSDYHAPEVVDQACEDYANTTIPRFPNQPGFWWYGNDVVKVEVRDAELVMRLPNNHRKRIHDVQDRWGGPAVADPRVAPKPAPMSSGSMSFIADAPSEDIPL